MGGFADWGRAFRDNERVAAERRERSRLTRENMRSRRARGYREALPPALLREAACESCGHIAPIGELNLTATGHRCPDCEITLELDASQARGVRRAVAGSIGLSLATGVLALGMAVALLVGDRGMTFMAMSVMLAWPVIFLGNLMVSWAAGRHQSRTLAQAGPGVLTPGQRRSLWAGSLACYTLATLPLALLAGWLLSLPR